MNSPKRHRQGSVRFTIPPQGTKETTVKGILQAMAEMEYTPEWNQAIVLGDILYTQTTPRIASAEVYFVDLPEEPNPADQKP